LGDGAGRAIRVNRVATDHGLLRNAETVTSAFFSLSPGMIGDGATHHLRAHLSQTLQQQTRKLVSRDRLGQHSLTRKNRCFLS
jgi:hypothetical protein